MFGLFASEQSRARHDARNWLHLADKVVHFRRDQLPQPEVQALQQAINDLTLRLRERVDAAKLKMAIERLEGCLRRSGGAYYPKSSLVDNVEFFLVAMILFLGIRAFFVQPFKIPTNSMWPSYYGMTGEVFEPDAAPGLAAQALRLAVFGAAPYRIKAPAAGKVQIALNPAGGLYLESSRMRRWLLFPTDAYDVVLFVGETPVRLTVPADFRIDRVLNDAFFAGRRDGLALAIQDQHRRGTLQEHRLQAGGDGRGGAVRVLLLDSGRHVAAGELALAFDLLTGDQLFVDRLSYHFVRPAVGQGVVFRTDHIANIEPASGKRFVQRYYIKRLVGVPGDTLEVHAPTLFRNGDPIEGADAFELNSRRERRYPGYTAWADLEAGQHVKVPPGSFFAMGDNSPESSDSRRWGPVPAADVVGRPLMIYYPFTRRWGRSP